MARPVLHHAGRYVLWTTVMDAPLTTGLDHDSMVRHLSMRESRAPERIAAAMAAATEHGSSLQRDDGTYLPLAEILACNRAGEREAHIAPEELIRRLFINMEPSW